MDNLKQDIKILDDHQRPNFAFALMMILYHCFSILLWLPVSITCVPLFVLGLFIWGKPLIILDWSSYRKYFIAVFTEGKPEENVLVTNRITVFLIVLGSLIKIPFHGLCWYIDELVFSSYHKINIEKPVFMITGLRSGSSQLNEYLTDDTKNFIAPTIAEALFPYIWVWKLFVPILIRLGLQEYFYNKSMFGKEGTKRHHFILLKPESWDIMMHAWRFGACDFSLGSSFMIWGHSLARIPEPIDENLVRNFLPVTDCMMKKVMYYRGKPKQRMLLKGHFLLNARNIEQRYPKVKFFVVVRDPVKRLCSSINFFKVISEESKFLQGLIPSTWMVIRDHVIHTEVPYCEQEMSFYKEPADNKLVIPFTMYVNNLSATLQHIYSFCNIPIPDDVMSNAIRVQHTTHDFTERRASYDPRFKRSLSSLGVDEERLKDHLNEYIEWIGSLENNKES
ncbi:uncharacterized protein [Dysidea avara]|uniref:uncharacterized protein isoform X1 n=1 Tax=Dysidea avara TaxID=196820 RepID=UPI0033234ACA